MNVFMLSTTVLATILYLIGSVAKSDSGKILKNVAFGYIMGTIIAMIIKLGPLLV